MGSSQNVELEAAKFLHKLIQDSKDEPAKLATKLYVILQHMKSSGKEHSMPYQVISRAMETVINQHGLDIEALKSSRLPLTGGPQIGPSQAAGVAKDSRVGLAENEMAKMEPFAANRPPIAPSSGALDYYQGSMAQRSSQSFDQESPSSLDSRSANSQSQDRRDTTNWEKQGNQKDSKKATTKRKRGDTSSSMEQHADIASQLDSRNTVVNARKGKMAKAEPSDGIPVKSGAYGKAHGGMAVASGAYPLAEPTFSSSMQYGGALEHDGLGAATLADGHKLAQIGRQNSASEMTMLRQGGPPRDTGKSPVSSAPASSATPFKEQQLKQLRAQCLVFLAFRNGLPPKKLHLEIALGSNFSREDGSRKELIDHKGKSQSSNEPSNTSGMMMPFGGLNNVRLTDKNPSGSSSAGKILDAESLAKGAESPRVMEVMRPFNEAREQLMKMKADVEKQNHERMAAQACSNTMFQQQDSVNARGSLVVNNHLDDVDNGNLQVGKSNQPSSVMGLNKPVNPDISNWTGFASHNEALNGPLQVSLPIERRDNIPSHFQNIGNNRGGSQNPNSVNHLPNDSLKDHWKPASGSDSDHQGVNVMRKHVSTEPEGSERLTSADLQASPKYTMSERWILDQQKKRYLVEQNWAQKQQKTTQKLASCFGKLKENVSSSEDISAKTRSVIELKKLQLLDLQRRLHSDFLNDFFKPVTSEVEHLKSIKKHRHGRRVKQLERYEQKMKEERQKRIRERQKEFFGEIEVHKERLDDAFKIKRERWKGFNRYAKEFHKRKERIHREKIDRIQREKINLLKINDVEGYLRMVQDAKSDRVKQLLKETEKYLQKLGSKLQEAKTAAGHVDEAASGSIFEKNETTLENEDESDQAKHYLESNEKYYMMAHSIKESIAEQPSSLQGGKLREYQMNGLRWLVSLYNNHLNGILADEMGLGKTVQVIALICYLMETKNDRGPFLVVVPSSVLPGWETEISFWAPSVHKIVYAGPPEERRRLFKERIVHQKFNVLLTTYEYLMNKHDRPKLSKLHWHYIIIDEGHRIKNASCKLNADLKHYQSSHRLLLTGTPLQNNLEELWALLNFLLPNIFNSSEDFSQWFNKPFQSNGDSSPDEALLSEEENLLIINRLHQVLRPFVLRRLKHKVENELPEKIERLIRCEASAYQKLLMKRVEDNLGSIGSTKARSVHNSVMELRNICNHPYLSQLHAEEVDNFIPKHYLPPIVRLCGKLEMLDRLLPKLKATDHRVLFFSTMTRLLDVMEEYLSLKQYRYLRLDGHTSGGDRGALIDMFNQPGSPFFIFLLSIRAGGVGVNLQAADTVIIFDTDWNPQVDLQAQARAHRIGQKRDVLVLRFETVQTVEEQVRAAAEHKLGVANQSITAGFFDNNTSAEDRREYLESLLRECKKEEAAPVLDDDSLNDLLARSETELDVFEAVDKRRREDEMAAWKKLMVGQATNSSELATTLPSRLVTDDDLKNFYEAMKIYDDVPKSVVASSGVKRKGEIGGLDTQHYGRGKRTREVRSYEEQWTEEEFEKMCQVESPESPKVKEEVVETSCPSNPASSVPATCKIEPAVIAPVVQTLPSVESLQVQQTKEVTPPAKRGRGRPKRITSDKSPAAMVPPSPAAAAGGVEMQLQKGTLSGPLPPPSLQSAEVVSTIGTVTQSDAVVAPTSEAALPFSPGVSNSQSVTPVSAPIQSRGHGRKTQSGGEASRRRGKKQVVVSPSVPGGPDLKVNEQLEDKSINLSAGQALSQTGPVSSVAAVQHLNAVPTSASFNSEKDHQLGIGIAVNSQLPPPLSCVTPVPQTVSTCPTVPLQNRGQSRKSQNAGASRRRGKKQEPILPVTPDSSGHVESHVNSLQVPSGSALSDKTTDVKNMQQNEVQESKDTVQQQASLNPGDQDLKLPEKSDDLAKQISPSIHDCATKAPGPDLEEVHHSNVHDSSAAKAISFEITTPNITIGENSGNEASAVSTLPVTEVTREQTTEGRAHQSIEASTTVPSIINPPSNPMPGSASSEALGRPLDHMDVKAIPTVPLSISNPSILCSESAHPCPSPSESVPVKRQGRKTQNRVEPPRRRGRRHTSTLPIPDAHASQDSKVSQHSNNSSGDSLVGKGTTLVKHGSEVQEQTNATQTQVFQIQMASGTAVPDSKRKERTTISSQNKHQKGVPTRTDSAPVSSDKVASFGRIQVNDVARVMKEVFSGTCLVKPKAQESVGVEERGTPIVNMSNEAAVEGLNNQICEDKTCPDMPTTSAACLTSAPPMNKHENQSEEVSNEQNPEEKANSDIPTTEAVSLTAGVPLNGNEKLSGTSDVKAVLNEVLTYVSGPETHASGDVEEKEQLQDCIKSSTTQIDMEALHDAGSHNAAQEAGGSFEILPNRDESSLGKSTCSSSLDSGTGCPSILMKTDNSSDNSASGQPGSFSLDHSVTTGPSGINENTYYKKMGPTAELPSKSSPLVSCCGDDTGLLMRSDQPEVIPSSPATTSHSNIMAVSTMSERVEINSEKKTEDSLQASAELCLDSTKTSTSAHFGDSNTVHPVMNLDPAPSGLLEPDIQDTIENDSQNASETYIKPSSDSHEAEGLKSPKPVLPDQELSGLDNFDGHNSQKLVESSMQTENIKCSVEAIIEGPPGFQELIGVQTAPISVATPSTLQETPLLERQPESRCEEQNDKRDSVCEQLHSVVANPNIDDMEIDTSDSKRNNIPLDGEIVPETTSSSINMSSCAAKVGETFEDHSHEDPVMVMVSQPSGSQAVVHDSVGVSSVGDLPEDTPSIQIMSSSSADEEEKSNGHCGEDHIDRSMVSQPSGLEGLENDSVGVHQVGGRVDEIIPDIVVPLVNEEIRISSEISLIKDSEPQEESTKKGVDDISAVLEEANDGKADTDVQMDSSDCHILQEKCKDDLNASSCFIRTEEKLGSSSARGLTSSTLPSDELDDSKTELRNENMSQDGDILSGDNASIMVCVPLASKEEGTSCLSNDGSEGNALFHTVPESSGDIGDKMDVPQVDLEKSMTDAVQLLSSIAKEKAHIGVMTFVSQEDREGFKVDQSSCNVTSQAGDPLPENPASEVNKLPSNCPVSDGGKAASHFGEGELSLKEARDCEVENCGPMAASKALEVEPERYVSKDLSVPSSSLVTEEDKIVMPSDKAPPHSGTLPPEESRDLSTQDESYKDASEGTILNIIQQKEPDYSEADMGKEKEADQVPAVDSENPTFQTTDVMSSLVMVLDKSDTAEDGITEPSPLQESDCRKAEMVDQLDSSQVTGINPESLAFRNMDASSSSLETEECEIDVSCDKGALCSLLVPGESKGSFTEKESCTDLTVDPITNPLPLEESSNFGVDTRDQMESSMEVEEGKIDMPNDKEIPCSSLKLGKPTSCLIGNESCREDTMELINSGVEMSDQIETSQISAKESENLELRNVDAPSLPMEIEDAPSLPMEIEETMIDESNDEEPPSSLHAQGEQRGSLNGEESCRDATVDPNTNSLLLQESLNSGSGMGDQMEQEKLESGNMVVPLSLMANEESIAEEKSCRDVTVGHDTNPLPLQKSSNAEDDICGHGNEEPVSGMLVDDKSRLEAMTPAAGVESNQLDTLSDECSGDISEAPTESKDLRADPEDQADIIGSCATAIENVSEIPCSLASSDKREGSCEKDVDGSVVSMQIVEEADMIDEQEVTEASLDRVSPPRSSAVEDNRVESLEANDANNSGLIMPENAPKEADMIDEKEVTEASLDRVSPPCSSAVEDNLVESLEANDANNNDLIMPENAPKEADMIDEMEVTEASLDRVSPPCSSAVEDNRVESLEADDANNNDLTMPENAPKEADMIDEKEVTEASLDRVSPPCSSAVEDNRVESLEANDANNNDLIMPENAPKEADMIDEKEVTEASLDRVSRPCSSAAEDNPVESLEANDANNNDLIMPENAPKESELDVTDGKDDVTKANSDAQATRSVDGSGTPPPCSSTAEGNELGNSDSSAKLENAENDSIDIIQPLSLAAEGEIAESPTEMQQESKENEVIKEEKVGIDIPDSGIVDADAPENATASPSSTPAVEDNNADSLPEKDQAGSLEAAEVKESEAE